MRSSLNDLPTARYYPFSSGVYSTAAGLHKLTTDFGNGEADHRIFQIDAAWAHYRQNKEQCRAENLQKYVRTDSLPEDTCQEVCAYMIQQLLSTYPALFLLKNQQSESYLSCKLSKETLIYDHNFQLLGDTGYQSLLDALAFQVQEDIAIWQWDGKQDQMSLIHLCAPNHWAPADKIGKPFSDVHLPVAGMEKRRKRYQPMLQSLIKGGKFVRFAWGLSTDKRLNHHPEAPPGWEEETWKGRHFDPENPLLFVRIERQTLSGFPKANAVLFTIRTYFEEVNALKENHRKALLKALCSMSSSSLKYKGLNDDVENIKAYLS
ncbi:DUF3445 domain-containing protein [Catalinimonas sp. 4WD22]|uniref:heme-dependent oxidative N-demethylase family protein n=1 Tax=Catalinimonas locisalis TaxID=3133978 RepID=UPI0031012D68